MATKTRKQTKTAGPATKRVDYAYPTSSYATKFGFYNTGCYVVEVCVGIRPGKAVAAFATLTEARAHADTLPHEWNALSR